MAGHSHWAKIKRKKAVTDARRGRLWSKLARNIIVAARRGANPDDNLTLRYAIDAARAENVPNDTIDKAIKKGSGELGGVDYVPIVYEGYGGGGVAVLVEALTDNPTRTAGEIRGAFDRHGGNLGSTNCVAWMFKSVGVFVIAAADTSEDALMELAIDAGASDVVNHGEVFEVTCEPSVYEQVRKALSGKGLKPQSCEITRIADTTVTLDGDRARQVGDLVEALEENEDVQKVHTNLGLAAEG
ncbi:MAG: YebC/PmpR family DNA-binding transcriptional regulator [Phycisphaerae bacterium]